MDNLNLKKIIKEGNRKQLLSLDKQVKKSKPIGKIKRHQERKARNIVSGFGKSYSDDEQVFRVEFCWRDPQTNDESNEQVHWVTCRHFKGKQRKYLRHYFNQRKESWKKGETVESEIVLAYVASWIILNRDRTHLNQAFIFPSTKIGNETIRNTLYQVYWTGELPDWEIDKDLAIFIKNNISHLSEDNELQFVY